jgi:RNA polymerase sigma-70 factor (ECF subfamily)
MDALKESELLKACLRGDAQAWDTLFDRHYAATGRFICQLSSTFSREDIEEITQETFLTIIHSLSSFQGKSQFQTWLFRIAANKARDYRQKQTAAKRGGGKTNISIHKEDPVTGLTIDPPSKAPGPDHLLARNENAILVGQALEQLGGACQEIIELRYFTDLSYEEISKSLDLNPKTISSRLSKCLDKLETILKKSLLRENITPTSV